MADLSEQAQEETRMKLSGLSKIRQLEIDLNNAGEEKDDAEQRLEQLEKVRFGLVLYHIMKKIIMAIFSYYEPQYIMDNCV